MHTKHFSHRESQTLQSGHFYYESKIIWEVDYFIQRREWRRLLVPSVYESMNPNAAADGRNQKDELVIKIVLGSSLWMC